MATNLHQQIISTRQSLFDDEVLLEDRLIQLETLNNKDSPNFLMDMLNLFIRDSTSYLISIEESLKKKPIDDYAIERMLYRLKSASLSIGACKIRDELERMRGYCHQRRWGSAKACFQVLKEEHGIFKNEVVPYLELLKQARFTDVGRVAP